jgi:hypothetical protein
MPRPEIKAGADPVTEFPLAPIAQLTQMDVRSLAGTFDMVLRQRIIAGDYNHSRIDDKVQGYRAREDAAVRRVGDFKRILTRLGQAPLVAAIEEAVRKEHKK